MMSKYRWNAEDYAKHASAQQSWAREIIAKLGLQGHESVLDVGCGDGKITAEILAALPNGSVVGIDNAESMISLALKTYPRNNYPNLSFTLADASGLRFDQQFDVVVSNSALHWVLDHRPVLKGIHKALRSGGRMLLQMGGRGNASAILAVLAEMMCDRKWQAYFESFAFPYGFHGPVEYEVWLKGVGLKPLRIELIPKEMLHQGEAGLVAWIRTTWLPYLEHIPERERGLFIEALVKQYLQKYPVDPQGNVHVSMVRLEVEATKVTA